MKKTFCYTLFAFLCIWAFFSSPKQEVRVLALGHLVAQNRETQDRIAEIDREIKELEKIKRGYEARALQHQDAADRLQFQDQAYLETRRHLQLAEENRLKAQEVQGVIDGLQQEKRMLQEPS